MTEDAHSYSAVPDRAFADRLERELLRRLEAGDTVGSVLVLDLDPLDGRRSDVERIAPAAEPRQNHERPLDGFWRGSPRRSS